MEKIKFIAEFWNGKDYIKRQLKAFHFAQAQKIAETIAKKNGWERREITKTI